MRSLRRFLARLRNVATGRRFEDRLKEEIEQHLALQIEENLRAGLSPVEARRQAVLKFGAVEAIKEEYREVQGIRFFETLLQDLRYGFRNLRNAQGFTAVAILTLALGIGANTAIFSAVNGILIEHLPYADSSRLLTIRREQAAYDITFAEARAIQQKSTAFERLAIYDGQYQTVSAGDATRMQRMISHVTGDFFPMLAVKPVLGRTILADDTQPGRGTVAVLSYHLWMDEFGGDLQIVGRDIVVDKDHYTVIGVMPKEFELGVEWLGDSEEGLWLPMEDPPAAARRRGSNGGFLIAKVKAGVPLSAAKAQIETISARLAERFPKSAEGVRLRAERPKLFIARDVQTGLLILLGAVGFVLLETCVNVSALLVSQAWKRQRELAIRKALGASSIRIVRQLLSESALLALAGGALGLLFSVWGIRLLRAIAPPGTPRLDRLHLDSTVLWFTLGISLVSAILCGLLPALQASSRRVGGVLEGGLAATFAGPATRRRHPLRSGLLIAEVGLAVILVAGGALMVRSFDKLMHVSTGVKPDHVLTMQVQLSDLSCNQENWRATCSLAADIVIGSVNSTAGVERAALSLHGSPLQGGMTWIHGRISTEASQDGESFDGSEKSVTAGYFAAAGIRLLAGRAFVAADRDGPPVAVVSEAFARKYIPGNPLGKRFNTHDEQSGHRAWMEIVGEVNDTRDRAVREFSGPAYYTPVAFAGGSWQLIVRTSADPMAMASSIQRVVWSVDKAAMITKIKTVDQLLDESAAQPRFQTALLGSFSAIGLLLAVIGIYGVISYSMLQRTHEIGVRMALGARAGDIMRLIAGQGAALTLVGILLGLAGALALTRFLRSMLFEVTPADPATFVGIAVLLVVVALAACCVPARRAMRVDPTVALRHD